MALLNKCYERSLASGADEPCFLYVIGGKGDNAVFKIGVSDNVAERLRSLQVGNHEELEVIRVVEFPDRQSAMLAEREIHQELAGFKISGEWYRVPLSCVSRAVNKNQQP